MSQEYFEWTVPQLKEHLRALGSSGAIDHGLLKKFGSRMENEPAAGIPADANPHPSSASVRKGRAPVASPVAPCSEQAGGFQNALRYLGWF